MDYPSEPHVIRMLTEARKDKERESSPPSAGVTKPCLNFRTSDPKNCKMTHVSCFKALSLW